MHTRLIKPLVKQLRDRKKTAAVHEAAHSVVGASLGMPLGDVDILRRKFAMDNAVFISVGFSSYSFAEVEEAIGTKRAHEVIAVYAAAGIVAEQYIGRVRKCAIDELAFRQDLQTCLRFAKMSGVSREQTPLFVDSLCLTAEGILGREGGKVWNAVTSSLRHKTVLSGAEVKAIVNRNCMSQFPMTG